MLYTYFSIISNYIILLSDFYNVPAPHTSQNTIRMPRLFVLYKAL